MNNSRLDDGAALGQYSGFSDRKEAFSPILLAKVESTTTTRFDHVAAIKKITDSLLARGVSKLSFNENKNVVENPVPSSIPPLHAHHSVDRHWTSKRTSNRTKIRRPSSPHLPSNSKKKNNQNKIVHKNNSSFDSSLKNWPNTGVQNAEDFHNYDKYTSSMEQTDPIKLEIAHNPSRNSTFDHHAGPVSQRPTSNLQEIVHWLKIPAFVTNGSHVVEADQIDNPVSVTFDSVYQNLEPNEPSNPNKPQIARPGFIYPLHRPSHATENVPPRNKSENPLVRNPQTHVSQNTVLHFVNLDPSRVPSGQPISSSNTFASPSPSTVPQSYPSSTTSKPGGPNRVHIGFTSYEESKNPLSNQKPQTPMVTYDQNCPTILINSYTRINNTIQSKEGCTDLNIVINSHVFNSNVYKSSTPSPSTTDHRINSEYYQNYHDQVDKYGVSGTGSLVDDYYRPVLTYRPPTPQNDPEETDQTLSQQNDVSNFEVVQDTQISITNSDQASQTDSDLTATMVGTDVGQANHPPPVDSLVRPAVAPPANSDSSTGSSLLSPVGGLPSSATARPIEDEEEDEDYDLSPTGIMDSIASAFAYLTFNPLHYGFFSLAAAPFTALAAGILGVVTFLYPWLFPSSFGFARANDNASQNGYWLSGFEEVVRQSMERYGRMNEWKSKRKKRKR